MNTELQRPIISQYKDPVSFVEDMILFRKQSEYNFSVSTATKKLRRISPALISLILKKKRRITLDRVDELTKLLNLSLVEKNYFKSWITTIENPETIETSFAKPIRKEVGVHILSDWLNVYVKDCFNLKEIQENPKLIYQRLLNVAPPARIKKSLSFLIKHGYLKTTLKGHIVRDTPLVTSDANVSNVKVRNFHKNALKLAKKNIDLFSKDERYANTATVALTPQRYEELIGMIQEFAEKFKDFAEDDSKEASDDETKKQIYQFIVNLSPLGGE